MKSYGRIAVAIALILAGINGIWVLISRLTGPGIGVAAYLAAAYLCGTRRDFIAGIVIGTAGLAVHLYESLRLLHESPDPVRTFFLLANILLPALLALFSLKAFKASKAK